MQIPSLQSLPIANAGASTPRQQTVELAQSGQGADKATALPDNAQAVAATGQAQQQQAQNTAAKNKPSVTEQLQSSLKQLNSVASLYNNQLEFSVDKDTDLQVVKVVDKETQKVIRQIPSEDAIRIAKAIGDFKGMLLKDKA
ncbi:flagellar biosynthesis protein FlaG [Chromobacterium sp. Panama]|uniref:flagellar protein FlaG n=1 Tax=Chromobacterium sp. Panama TaxID=2161826 RepID=UPI000D319A32|nr:flagellar protein FlaG [Chromobacterium sp. Panama]PTU66434.1 flagellar biosynthesis protein FlaG [Chromobacterium sp. Panama]